MALIVETGTGVPGANSYVSVATADAYHLARGNTGWAGTDAAKEAAILRAMSYLEPLRWEGNKTAYTHALEWPRTGVVDRNYYPIPRDEVPDAVERALCEAALVELSTPGALLPTLDRGGQVVREKIGPIEIEYASSAPSEPDRRTIAACLLGLVRGLGAVELGRG